RAGVVGRLGAEHVGQRQAQPGKDGPSVQGGRPAYDTNRLQRLIELDQSLAGANVKHLADAALEVLACFLDQFVGEVVWANDLDRQVRDHVPGVVPVRLRPSAR